MIWFFVALLIASGVGGLAHLGWTVARHRRRAGLTARPSVPLWSQTLRFDPDPAGPQAWATAVGGCVLLILFGCGIGYANYRGVRQQAERRAALERSEARHEAEVRAAQERDARQAREWERAEREAREREQAARDGGRD